MINKKVIAYKIMSQSEISKVGNITITNNSISLQVQDNYTNAIRSIVNDISIRGEFDNVTAEKVKNDTVNITNVSEKFVSALKEECVLKLGLIWI